MELQAFISGTLSAIIAGVADAQKQATAHGAHVNPGRLMRTTAAITDNSIWDNRTNNYARTVTFDVAVSVEKGESTSAKIGVVAGVLGLGAAGESQGKESAVSRIQFAVPVLFPVSDVGAGADKPVGF